MTRTRMIALALLSLSSAAYAEYMPTEVRQAENTLKMIIGLNNLRCAQVTYVEKLQGSVYGVTCLRKAGSPVKAHYAIDAANNAVVSVH